MTKTPRSDGAEFYYDGPTGFVQIDFARKLEMELNTARADVIEAAGELRLPIPEPGSDMAKMMAANVILRRQNASFRDSVNRLKDEVQHQALRANAWRECCDMYAQWNSSTVTNGKTLLDLAVTARAALLDQEGSTK